MTPRKGFRVGLLISGTLVFLILMVAVYIGLSSYDGYCIYFEPPKRPCTMWEFLLPYLFLLILYWIFGKPIWTIIIFILLLAPPLIGFFLGRKKTKAELDV